MGDGRRPLGSVSSSEGSGTSGSCRLASPRTAPPLVRLRSPSAFVLHACGSAPLVRRSLLALAARSLICTRSLPGPSTRSAGPRGLPAGVLSQPAEARCDAALEVTPSTGFDHPRPPRVDTHPPARAARAHAVPSCEFVPLRRLQARGVHSPRVCLSRYVPPPGSLTLLTACSSAYPSGLFHPVTPLGFRPPEPCSRPTSRCTSRRSVPS